MRILDLGILNYGQAVMGSLHHGDLEEDRKYQYLFFDIKKYRNKNIIKQKCAMIHLGPEGPASYIWHNQIFEKYTVVM